jgi:hypothetical protein
MIKMIKNILTLGFVFIAIQGVWAQSKANNDMKGIIYSNEKALDMRIHTHGWALNYQFGKLKSYYRTVYYNVGIGELKHHKEVKKSTDFSNLAPSNRFGSYTFGKQNYAFALRGGLGMKRYYSEKANKNGVALGLNFQGGFTGAIMKPYYVDLGGRDINSIQSIKYTPERANDFLDQYKIRGKSGFSKGLNEVQFIPGIHAQAGVHLDWGAFDEFLRGVEAGIMLDVFAKNLPIMINEENRPYFLNLYVSLQLGKRN